MIYIKPLTKSDLTIIARFWEPKLKQEAIVISRKFVRTLGNEYINMTQGEAIGLQLRFYGPEGKGAIVRNHASIKKQSNDWRIQECSLQDPDDDQERFARLEPRDFFIFTLNEGEVRTGRGLFVSKRSERDKPLYDALTQFSNMAVDKEPILAALIGFDLAEAHPIYSVVNQSDGLILTAPDEEIVEAISESEFVDAMQAGTHGLTDKSIELSKDALDEGLQEAARIGRDGESLLDRWLETRPSINSKRITNHTWVANRFATAPYDFELEFDDNTKILLELKSTNGPFGNKIYISNGELRKICGANVILARLYQLDENPELRFAWDIRPKAEIILASIGFPEDAVELVSVRVLPDFFGFEEEIIKLDDS